VQFISPLSTSCHSTFITTRTYLLKRANEIDWLRIVILLRACYISEKRDWEEIEQFRKASCFLLCTAIAVIEVSWPGGVGFPLKLAPEHAFYA
jgi:hypothetical protein